MKKKIKSNAELAKEIRGVWNINPVTRVHDDNLKKDKKKLRLRSRKICKKGLENYDTSPFVFCI